jgi:hypothetical protein
VNRRSKAGPEPRASYSRCTRSTFFVRASVIQTAVPAALPRAVHVERRQPRRRVGCGTVRGAFPTASIQPIEHVRPPVHNPFTPGVPRSGAQLRRPACEAGRRSIAGVRVCLLTLTRRPVGNASGTKEGAGPGTENRNRGPRGTVPLLPVFLLEQAPALSLAAGLVRWSRAAPKASKTPSLTKKIDHGP